MKKNNPSGEEEEYPPHGRVYYALLAVVTHGGLVVMTYFAVDRYRWDSDSSHFADFDTVSYFNVEMLIAYAASTLLSVLCISMRVLGYSRSRLYSTLEGRGLAMSIPLSLMSLTQLSYDLWWRWYGTYSPLLILVMAVITVIVLIANLLMLSDVISAQSKEP